ncbi:glycosyltransferase [Synechococcus sp. BMK-MC-1]|uniref:glycosyltransferase n=1 Tax=Synechococcus sp. BMK-MC-1 TaxID=1442551 RepID=UPI001644E6C1|nr:glycosyltransferase [Synechococcus sp. BMK-MC-1]QNI66432.1 putative alpha-glycosyltransferase/ family 4 [Synechococcus sp. BMK-MC-1]
MKILRIIRSLDPLSGGPAEGIRQITPHLKNLGVATTVVSLDSPDELWLQDQPFEAIGLGPVAGSYGYRRGLPYRILTLAKDHDAVIIEGIWQYHAYATWRALRGGSIPYFVYTHGMLDPWFKRTYPLKHLKKWAYWPWADYRVLRDATATLFTTEQERLLAKQSFWLFKSKDKVVGFGTSSPPSDVEGQRCAFLQRFPHLRDQRILLFLSRIHPKKGVDLLIDAFAAVAASDPRLCLVIAGPDQVGWQASLHQRAVALGIADRITWPGMLNGELKWGAFRCAELFCLPSHQENFGIVVAEALACGLPVAIAEPVNIATDIVRAAAGIVYADTASSTEEALRRWLSMTPQSRGEMGRRGLQLFIERFDFASVAKNLIPVLSEQISYE